MYKYQDITSVELAFEHHPDSKVLSEMKGILSTLPANRFTRGMLSTLNAQVLTEVMNNDDPSLPPFKANYNDDKQKKYGPLCIGGDASGAGFRVYVDGWSYSLSSAYGRGRLALRDPGRLQHMKKYHPDVYKEYFLVLE